MSLPIEQPAFHGYAPEQASHSYRPPLSIVISRESGSRGPIDCRANGGTTRLGLSRSGEPRIPDARPPAGAHGRATTLEPTVARWVDQRLDELNKDGTLLRSPQVTSLIRHILETAAQSHSVILARGAGRVLPADARLHVKIVAPLQDRISFIAQINRLSLADAKQFVLDKDRAREEFLAAKLHVEPSDLSEYDLVINTVQLGVEGSARLIAAAAREKIDFLHHQGPIEKTWRVGMP